MGPCQDRCADRSLPESRLSREEHGHVTIFVIGMVMIVFAVIGLAVDGTRAFLHRRTLQSAADAAALAGASELDRDQYYVSRGRSIEIDPGAARRAAGRWLELRSLPAEVGISASSSRVTVTLRSEVSTLFLRLIGLSRVPVAVEAASAPAAFP